MTGVIDRTRCLAAGAIATIVLLLSFAPTAGGHTPGTSGDFFGVNGTMLRSRTLPDKTASLDRLAASMGQQGISWARITFDQSVEERQRDTFNWHVPDTMVAALARHGVRGAAAFVGTAAWADDEGLLSFCGSRAHPAHIPGWADWVAAAARRYGPNGSFWAAHPELPPLPIRTWEIGNEVNSDAFWCPSANPDQYARVFAASAGAIRSVDPSAQVIVGGLAQQFGHSSADQIEVSSFLRGMIAANPALPGMISAVGIHPYAPSVDEALETVVRFRNAISAAGLPNTPMVANEIGWHTRGLGPLRVSESERADLISAMANAFWRTDCGLSSVAPYAWMTLEQNLFDREHWFGLADPDSGVPYPSGLAYGAQIRLALGQASSPPPTTTLELCGSSAPASDPAPSPSQEPSPQSGPLESIGKLLPNAGPIAKGAAQQRAKKKLKKKRKWNRWKWTRHYHRRLYR